MLEPGDVVRCTNATLSDGKLKDGEHYEISSVGQNGERIILNGVDVKSPDKGWYAWRFKREATAAEVAALRAQQP